MSLNLELIKKTFTNVLKHLGHLFIIGITLIAGMVIGYYYNILSTSPKKDGWQKVYGNKDISIAINEKNQILFIDKKDGTYKTYDDSIGINLFNIYASRIKKNINE